MCYNESHKTNLTAKTTRHSLVFLLQLTYLHVYFFLNIFNDIHNFNLIFLHLAVPASFKSPRRDLLIVHSISLHKISYYKNKQVLTLILTILFRALFYLEIIDCSIKQNTLIITSNITSNLRKG